MDNWLHLLQAGAVGDRDACVEWSLKLGYLTGEENEVSMKSLSFPPIAHLQVFRADYA